MIVTGSPPTPQSMPQSTARHYYTGPQRAAAIEPLVTYADNHDNAVPNALIKRTSMAIGRSEGHVRKMLREEQEERAKAKAQIKAGIAPPLVLPVPMDFLVFAASLGGNIAQAHREYDWGTAPPHYSTILRRIDRIDTALVTVLQKGIAAFDRYLAVGIFECQYRNERWTGDETHIPVPCRGPRGSRIDNIQLLSFFDDFARLVTNANGNVGPASGPIVRATFARAVVGDDIDGVHVAGPPDVVVLDNAEAFKGVEISRGVEMTDVSALQYARPHTAQDKAKLERWHKTLKYTWLIALAGFLKGPVRTIYEDRIKADGKKELVRIDRAYSELPTSELPDYRALIAAVYEIIDFYNRNHVVSTTGMTPIAKYASDPSIQIEIGAEAMWDMALPLPRLYTVEHRGINIGGTWYDAPPLEFMRRASVTARLLPGMKPIVLAGQGEKVIAALTRKQDETEGDQTARAARNRGRQSFARQLLVKGAEQSKSEMRSFDDEDVVEDRARARGKRSRPALANDDELLGLAG